MTEADFRAAVKAWVQARDGNRRTLADAFEATSRAVDGWWLGTVTPRPAIQELILAWIRAQATA